MGQASPNSFERRLDSWKEIAAFFGRDERTVRRWEKENALPIHRVPGGAKGRVYAYESELREWLSTPQAVEDKPAPVEAQPREVQPAFGSSNLRSAGKWAAVLVACAVLAGGILLYRRSHRFAVNASETRMSRNPGNAVHRSPTPAAEEFYLKGRYFWNKRTPEDLNKAVDLFTQAIVQDPGYAQAYVGLADCYNLLREYSAMPPNEAYPRALAAAKKAVELDDSSAEAHNSLAFATFYWSWDPATAEREFKRAIALKPDYVAAHHWYATFLMARGRFPESVSEIEKARKLDPSSTPIMADRAYILHLAGQREYGITLLKQLETGEPAFLSPHLYLSYIYFHAKDYPNYFPEAEKVAMLRHDKAATSFLKAGESGFADGGVHGMWEAMLPLQKKFYAQNMLRPYLLAQTYSALDDKTEALKYLREAHDQRDAAILFISTDPVFDVLRGDPLFNELLAQSGQPQPSALP